MMTNNTKKEIIVFTIWETQTVQASDKTVTAFPFWSK